MIEPNEQKPTHYSGTERRGWVNRERLSVASGNVFKKVGLTEELKADDNTIVAECD